MAGTKKGARTIAQERDALYMKKYGMRFHQYNGRLGGNKRAEKLKIARKNDSSK